MNCFYIYFAVLLLGAQASVIKYPTESRVDDSVYDKCQNGWLRFENSCYFVEKNEKATFGEAKKECEKKSGKLFTPNSEEEYKTVMAYTTIHSFTWTGLSVKNDDIEPEWQAETKFEYEDLNWLVKPYNSTSNGFSSSMSQCVGFYNGNKDNLKYNYFYPCEWKFYYICEKESPPVRSD